MINKFPKSFLLMFVIYPGTHYMDQLRNILNLTHKNNTIALRSVRRTIFQNVKNVEEPEFILHSTMV